MMFHPCEEAMGKTKGRTLPVEVDYESSRKLAHGNKKAQGAGGAKRNRLEHRVCTTLGLCFWLGLYSK